MIFAKHHKQQRGSDAFGNLKSFQLVQRCSNYSDPNPFSNPFSVCQGQLRSPATEVAEAATRREQIESILPETETCLSCTHVKPPARTFYHLQTIVTKQTNMQLPTESYCFFF